MPCSIKKMSKKYGKNKRPIRVRRGKMVGYGPTDKAFSDIPAMVNPHRGMIEAIPELRRGWKKAKAKKR